MRLPDDARTAVEQVARQRRPGVVVADSAGQPVTVLLPGGLAARNGTPISFWRFTRYGLVVAALSVALAAPHLWLRYFVLA